MHTRQQLRILLNAHIFNESSTIFISPLKSVYHINHHVLEKFRLTGRYDKKSNQLCFAD